MVGRGGWAEQQRQMGSWRGRWTKGERRTEGESVRRVERGGGQRDEAGRYGEDRVGVGEERRETDRGRECKEGREGWGTERRGRQVGVRTGCGGGREKKGRQ